MDIGCGTFFNASINSILSTKPSFFVSIYLNNNLNSLSEKLNFSNFNTFSNSSGEITFSNLNILYFNKTSKYSLIKSNLFCFSKILSFIILIQFTTISFSFKFILKSSFLMLIFCFFSSSFSFNFLLISV